MKRTIIFWIIAFIISILSAYYQRITGPTYPLSGSEVFQGKELFYKFDRSHSTEGACPVILPLPDSTMKATLVFNDLTKSDVNRIEMKIYKDTVVTKEISDKLQQGYFAYGELPAQPPTGKLQYYVRVMKDNYEKAIPEKDRPVVRFKGEVPALILILHIIFMFAAMLLAVRTALEYLNKPPNIKKFVYWTIGLLFIGGFPLGMLVQKYAFGDYWTGVPFGFDLTDNKTLISFIGWLAALIAVYKSKKHVWWVIGAAVLMLAVFLIPHSVLGS